MNPRIGINPISWSNDDLQYIGGDISLQTCLREAAAAGYDGVELGHKFPRDAAQLNPELEPHGLKLVSGWYSGQLLQRSADEEINAMRAHAGLLRDMNCDVLIFAEVTACIHSEATTRLSQRPRLRADQWPEFGRRLTEVARAAASEGLKLCFHHHMGTVVQSSEDIDALMQETGDEVYLLLDTGHALYAGADPVQLARQYANRIGHVHCKDIRLPVLRQCRNRDSSFLAAVLDGVFTVPGDGCVDYPSVFPPLVDKDYGGWFVVEAEQDPSVAPPLAYAVAGHNFLSDALKRAYSVSD
ncbi:MAG TPA: myo-inosose-2 dehydratase [Xanthomonadales bacterium]|nr:myo-inosose-2 dehydratase [Xanthomonadales bacterium]